MLISVIVPTCNRKQHLNFCLQLLSPTVQTIDANDYEVIVTEDSIENDSKNLIEAYFSWVNWIEGPKAGPAANRNNGASIAQGEWLVFIDDDCLPEINILSEYKKAITTRTDILAFEGRIYVDKPQSTHIQESPINNSGGYFWSCNICVHRKLFFDLGGFDANFPFPAMEDTDLFYRLKKVTNKHLFLYSAAVLHPWRTNKNLFKVTLNRYKSLTYYLRKHPEERHKFNSIHFLRIFAMFMLCTFRNAIRFRFSGFKSKFLCNFLELYFGFRALFKLDY